MTDPPTIYPPAELQRVWGFHQPKHHPNAALYMRYRIAEWCAAEAIRLSDQFPRQGITARRPTAEDGDRFGRVQWLSEDNCWYCTNWELIASSRDPWLHTPGWQLRAPKQKEQPLIENAS